MASKKVVERVLMSIARMYGKHPLWVDDCIKMWTSQLADVSDRDLIIGCKDLLRTVKTLPTVAQLREIVEASPLTDAGNPVVHQGCAACRGSGMRQMARWYINKANEVTIYNCVAACDCHAGTRLYSGSFATYVQIEEQWRRNPATTEVYHATAENPVLSAEQTLTAEEREARKGRAHRFQGQGIATEALEDSEGGAT